MVAPDLRTRRKNALQASQVRAPKWNPVDGAEQILHGINRTLSMMMMTWLPSLCSHWFLVDHWLDTIDSKGSE